VIVFARIITEKFKMVTNSEGHSKRNHLLCFCLASWSPSSWGWRWKSRKLPRENLIHKYRNFRDDSDYELLVLQMR